MFSDIIGIDNLNTLDLHGEIVDIARVRVIDFINDNYKIGNRYVVIIHGKGTMKIKNMTHEVLKNSDLVEDYKLYYFNDGCTIVKIKQYT